MIGATMAYVLEEKRKRKEAEAKAAQRNAAEEQRKVNSWLEGQAMLNAYLEEAKKQGAGDTEIAKLKHTGATVGLGEALKEAEAKVQTLSAQNVARQQALEDFRAQERDSAVVEAWQEQKQTEDLQAGLAAYYNARKQGEQESETNWWERAGERLHQTWFNGRDWANRVVGAIPDSWRAFLYSPLKIRRQTKGPNLVVSVNQKTLNTVSVVTNWVAKKFPWIGIKPIPSKNLDITRH
ncbi:MAG: hypothetical protein IT314_05595 [Anaerolineales bacterium]|nr:hypothetical protein [Anaerolineales bacterium]